MNIALWATQILLVFVFGYSALIKGTQSTERAVELGMTGVVNVSLPMMRLAAYCEVLGVIGLIVPYVTGVLPILTPMAAIGLGVIMVLAAGFIWVWVSRPQRSATWCCWRCASSWRGAGGRNECADTTRWRPGSYDAAVAGDTPRPLAAAVSGVVLGGALARSLRAVSHERGLARLDVEKHAKDQSSS
jgi:hypothetical protein